MINIKLIINGKGKCCLMCFYLFIYIRIIIVLYNIINDIIKVVFIWKVKY